MARFSRMVDRCTSDEPNLGAASVTDAQDQAMQATEKVSTHAIRSPIL